MHNCLTKMRFKLHKLHVQQRSTQFAYSAGRTLRALRRRSKGSLHSPGFVHSVARVQSREAQPWSPAKSPTTGSQLSPSLPSSDPHQALHHSG